MGKDDLEKDKEKGAAAAAAPAPPAKKDDKDPEVLTVNVGIQCQYACPHCGEVSKDTDEMELTAENEYRAEIPAASGKCEFCGKPVRRERIVAKHFRADEPKDPPGS